MKIGLLTNVKCTIFIIILIIGSSLVMTNVPDILALSDSDFDYQYINGDAEVEITGYHGTDGHVNIPSTIDGKPVTSIGDYSFSYQNGINKVTVPSTVASIGSNAFYSCSALTMIEVDGSNTFFSSIAGVVYDKGVTTLSICPPGRSDSLTVPATVTTIGSSACNGCASLLEVKLPEGLTKIGDYAFQGCTRLTAMIIPTTVSQIGYSAFDSCSSLRNITIPSGVIDIANYAFSNCDAMVEISVSVSNPNYASAGGILYNKAVTRLIQCPAGKNGTSTIPGTVTIIEPRAFYHCSINSVLIPEGVVSIKTYAFAYCSSLTNLTIPSSVSDIGYNAFYQCPALGLSTWDQTIPTMLVSMASSMTRTSPN